MIELVVFRAFADGARQSLGVHCFEIMPEIGHEIEIMEPYISGTVARIIHTSSMGKSQTEIVIDVD